MSSEPSRKNWQKEETVKLMQLVYDQREYLRHKLRKNKIDRIWERLYLEFQTFHPGRSVDQLKTKWKSICQTHETGADATNLPPEVNAIMQMILDEEALLNQGTDVSESLASGGRDPSPTSENALPSQHTIDGRNSSPEGVQIQADIQETLNEINERLKMVELRVTNLENGPKKKE